MGLQEAERTQLQVLEVQRRLAVLRLAVRLREARQELLQQLPVAGGELLEGERPDGLARVAEGRRPNPSHGRRRELDQALGEPRRLEEVEHVDRRVALRLGRLVVRQEQLRLGQELCDRVVEALASTRLERQGKAGRAQRVVDADEHLAQPARLVGREQLPAVGLVRGAELLQGGVEGLALEHPRLRLVEHPEPGVDARRERIGGEQPAAEAVDRGDPGAIEVAGQIGTVELEQARADARPQLPGGAIRVRDHEQRVDVEPVLEHRTGEPLDEHGRLAGAGARRDERRAPRLDRGLLLVVGRSEPRRQAEACRRGLACHRAHGRSLRHMRQRSHQPGQSPP